MAMGRVHRDCIHSCANHEVHARFEVLSYAHRRADDQASLHIGGSVGIVTRLLNILDRQQTLQHSAFIHERKLFDAVFLQNLLGFLGGDTYAGSDQALFFGHKLIYR